jgi:SpoVK/Ycf46/Vps4 family AAA+-type ATPase
MPQLCPTQQQALTELHAALAVSPITWLSSERGAGRTTVLRQLCADLDGEFVPLANLVMQMRTANPLALEEMFERLISEALFQYPAVVCDDVDLLQEVVDGCGSYPRNNWLAATLQNCCDFAEKNGRRIILGVQQPPHTIRARGYGASLEEFTAEDYEVLTRALLPAEVCDRLDFPRIKRQATHLTALDLAQACRWLAREESLSTERFLDYLTEHGLTSNIALSDVRQVSLKDLQGIDDLIVSLETHVVLPLENDALATEYGLHPKRGVLLLGPPGTGKTTIGRALAHRLKSRFFRVDGTFIPGTDDFYWRIKSVFRQAQHNAPAVVFIDDCDAMFQSGQELGLYRYLLTMLDGLESEGCRDVCVIFTAMELADLPPALLRSGRIELWLETRLPDATARQRIFERLLRGAPADLADLDLPTVVDATEGFTGADLDPVISDGKKLFVADKLRGCPLRPVTEYFLAAAQEVRRNKSRYAEAKAAALDRSR